MSVFSERLREARNEKGIKQADIAAQLGVSVQSYSAYENGREPNYDTLVKLAAMLDIDSAYLIGESSYKKRENAGVCQLTGLSEKAVERLINMKLDGEKEYSWINGEAFKYADLVSAALEADQRLASGLLNYVNARGFYSMMSCYINFADANEAIAKTSSDAEALSIALDMLSARIASEFMAIVNSIQAQNFTPSVEGYHKFLVDREADYLIPFGGAPDGDD